MAPENTENPFFPRLTAVTVDWQAKDYSTSL